ncbi:hypothetical protein C7H19_03495 [Aphanothece hegewaldii CCALA 016]|uniref:Uncharacterized protein n=1 Tax=Aphanothece hegewaldii CCALA 016 TaxID=2107694 RepID=A0A2T1M1S9_9CHRO|nr:hypothetical protein [Aphanothece hegewaldii]PSF38585.1 hypothetical protein C7H19_03495 [Aphanothece hegewaldii CCALA 016]
MQSELYKTLTTLEKLSPKALEAIGQEHLEYSNYKIIGYWDETKQYYEEITLKKNCFVKLSSYSIEKHFINSSKNFWIKLKFKIQAEEVNTNINNIIGEMILILDHQFQYIDENWLIDVNSPFVVAKVEKEIN